MLNFKAAGIIALLVGAGGLTTHFKGQLTTSSSNAKPTCATASGTGDICADGDLETNGALDVASTSTLTGAVTASSTLAVTGNSTFTGAARAAGGSIIAATTMDADDCGHSFAATAAADGDLITLPDADQVLGCEITISYIGADGGALIDITPLDSDADGIEGGCYETATDTVVYFSGTADADIGLTKATGLTGDYIKLWACDAAMWCVVGCQGIWANN